MSQWNRASNAVFCGLVAYAFSGDAQWAAGVIAGVFMILSVLESFLDVLANKAAKKMKDF